MSIDCSYLLVQQKKKKKLGHAKNRSVKNL